MRLSQRLSRLSQTLGKSCSETRETDIPTPYYIRVGMSLSLGWGRLQPIHRIRETYER